MKLLIATKNAGKVKEIKELLADTPITLTSLFDEPIEHEVIEDGTTFLENALQKAHQVASYTAKSKWILADDSGLEVDALNGEPGVRSSRFFGPGLTDAEKVERLLNLLAAVPDEQRSARFKCVAVLLSPQGKSWTTTGSCEGVIARKPEGSDGFGYDPVFYIPELRKTFAQLTSEEKSRLSHRGKAMRAMREILLNLLTMTESM